QNGNALVAGGYNGTVGGLLAEAELYTPSTGKWTPTGSLNDARAVYTLTLLSSGQVLAAAGNDGNPTFHGYANSAELYTASSGTWAFTGSLNTPRDYHSAALLANAKVLVAGGGNYNGNLTSAELYTPATGQWTATGSMSTARAGQIATLLQN